MSGRDRGRRGHRGGHGGGRGDGYTPNERDDGWDPTPGTPRETPNPIQSQFPTRSRGGLNPTSGTRRGPRETPNPIQSQLPFRSRGGLDPTSGAPRGPRETPNPIQSQFPTRGRGGWDPTSSAPRGPRETLNPSQSPIAHASTSGGTRDGGGNVSGNDAYTPGSQIFQSGSSHGRGTFDRQHVRSGSNRNRGTNRGKSNLRGRGVEGGPIFR